MADPTNRCSNCGSVLEGADQFCGECGAPVGAPRPPTPSPSPVPAAGKGLSGAAIGGIAAVVAAVAVGGTLLLTGGDDDSTAASTSSSFAPVAVSSTTTTTETVAESTTTTTAEPVAALEVGSLEDARLAVVQIVTTGTFVTPEGAQANLVGAGSGFIIDESGLAVTANHVVGGAATIEVFLDGEDRPRNAFVVGVSECSDLAVIDIDGDGYRYLEWYEGDPSVGLAVYAAGFPLADPEYTLVEGIVSKEDSDGDSSWASIDAEIEHTADALVGNSGGPLITADGTVVGVHYASNDLGQGFAISAEIAEPIVTRLAGGGDSDSIGVNGEAMFLADGIPGIWVYSVKAGSPADNLGIVPGDVVWQFEGVDVAADGTMAAYCDVLRSHAPGATLDIQVYRPGTGEIFAGQINGRALEAVFTPPPPADDVPTDGVVQVEYMDHTDASGNLYLQVPTTWDDIFEDTFNLDDDGTVVGQRMGLAPDLDAYFGDSGPGVVMIAYRNLDQGLDEYLDFEQQFEGVGCLYGGREDFYDGSYYRGRQDTYIDCGPAGAMTLYVVAAYPPDASYTVILFLQAVTDADFAALGQIIRTFGVFEGDLPGSPIDAAGCSMDWTVQSGTVQSAGNGSVTAAITAVDRSKSFLVFSTRHSLDRPVVAVRGRIAANGASVEFVRETDETSTVDIAWYVVTYPCGVIVQHGEATGSPVTTDVALDPITATDQAFVLFSKSAEWFDGAWSDDDPTVAEITSTTNLQFRHAGVDTAHRIFWQVVEFTDPATISVQRGATSIVGTDLISTVTLPTAVDTTRAFPLVSFRMNDGTISNVGAHMIGARLTGPSTLVIERSTAGTNDIIEILWEVVELNDRSTVLHNEVTLDAGVASALLTIPSLAEDKAYAFATVQGGHGQSLGQTPYAADDISGVSSFTLELEPDVLILTRANTAAAASVGWVVVSRD